MRVSGPSQNQRRHGRLEAALHLAGARYWTGSALPALVGTTLPFWLRPPGFSFRPMGALEFLLATVLAHSGFFLLQAHFERRAAFAGETAKLVGAAVICFLLAGLLGIHLLRFMPNLIFVSYGSAVALAGALYVAPPARFSRRPGGEIVLAMALGLLPVLGAYLVQTGDLTRKVYVAALPIYAAMLLWVWTERMAAVQAGSPAEDETLISTFGRRLSGRIVVPGLAALVCLSVLAAVASSSVMPMALLALVLIVPMRRVLAVSWRAYGDVSEMAGAESAASVVHGIICIVFAASSVLVVPDAIAQEAVPPPHDQLELTEDGAWSWLPDPRAVSCAGANSSTYAGWVDSGGEVWVGSYDHNSGEICRTRLTDGLGGDDHSNPSLLVLPDGRIMVFYSAHGGAAVMSRTTASPAEISAWEEERPVTQVRPFFGRKWGYTYPNAVRLAADGGRIFVFFRGPDFKPWFVTSRDGVTWTDERPLMTGPGAKPYVKYASDGVGEIHIAFTDGHPRGEPTNSIYYLCYRGGAFFRADGTRALGEDELPFTPVQADKVYDGAGDGGRAWVSDIALSTSGAPTIVFAVFPEPNDHRCRYARWDGSRWIDHEITPTGSSFAARLARRRGPAGRPLDYLDAGASLDPDDASVVFLAREVGSIYEIERWSTPDGGRTWQGTPVTSRSSAHNVRPAVPRGRSSGGPEVMWLTGTYNDYDAYEMSIRMLVSHPPEGRPE